MTTLGTATVALALFVAAGAQALPDFTGRWLRVDTSGDTAGWEVADAITVRQVVADGRTAADSPMRPFVQALEIGQTVGAVVHDETWTIGVGGGSVSGIGGPGQVPRSRTESAVEWRGDRLLKWNSTTVRADDGLERVSERAQEWSLDADGRLVIAVRTRESGQDSRRGRLIYRRAP